MRSSDENETRTEFFLVHDLDLAIVSVLKEMKGRNKLTNGSYMANSPGSEVLLPAGLGLTFSNVFFLTLRLDGPLLGRNRSKNSCVGIAPIENPYVSRATLACMAAARCSVLLFLRKDLVVLYTRDPGLTEGVAITRRSSWSCGCGKGIRCESGW